MLRITKCSNLDLIVKFSLISHELTELRMYDNEKLGDDTMARWMLETSMDDIMKLYINNNGGLAKIPQNLISRSSRLSYFNFNDNTLESGKVERGLLRFSFIPIVVSLTNFGINTVEPDSIKCSPMVELA